MVSYYFVSGLNWRQMLSSEMKVLDLNMQTCRLTSVVFPPKLRTKYVTLMVNLFPTHTQYQPLLTVLQQFQHLAFYQL